MYPYFSHFAIVKSHERVIVIEKCAHYFVHNGQRIGLEVWGQVGSWNVREGHDVLNLEPLMWWKVVVDCRYAPHAIAAVLVPL